MKKGIKKTIGQYVEGLLSLIYPDNCVICSKELTTQDSHFCFVCESELHYTDFEKYADSTLAEERLWGRVKVQDVYALLYYEHESSTKHILHQIKYKNNKSLGLYMGEMIGTRLMNSEKYTPIECIVPIPIHSKRAFSRGYNQSLLIAQGISKVLDLPIVEAFYRKSHDKSQTKQSRDERYESVKDKFGCNSDKLVGYTHVLLVDDVLTTGSTLESVGNELLSSNPLLKVSIATIAVAN